MKVKRLFSLVLALTVMATVFAVPVSAASLAGTDYGTVTQNSDGSVTLNFGADSITVKGNRGDMVTDSANGGVLRPDNLRTNDSNEAVLTMGEVDLNNTGYDKIDLYVASKNDAAVTVKVGETEVAAFANVNNGAWDSFKTNTASLTTTEASGNLTLNITGIGANQYCGNYVYVKLYGSGGSAVPDPTPTAAPPEPAPVPTADPDMPYTITGAEYDDSGALQVTYVKGEDAPEGATLLAASYADSSEAEMTAMTNVPLDGSGAQTVALSKPERGIVKVFIWDGISSMQPLSNTKKIAVNISSGEPIYMDTSYSFEERAADLVSRMTLEEKISQLGKDAPAIERLGVSKYQWWKECLHGVARQGQATSFSSPLGLSNTWDRELIYTISDLISTEIRAKSNRYNLSFYTPTINMARDPRWGRNEETYGEDPYLTSQLGTEFVNGLQGNDPKYLKAIATIKHYTANNNESYRRGGSSVMTEFNLRNYYTRVFKDVTEAANPGSVMASYNATTVYRNGSLLYNYIPSAANSYTQNDLLRRNWGFDGYITTDCGAGEDLINTSAYKKGSLGSDTLEPEAYIANALKNGMDLECNLGGGNKTQQYGVAAVEKGYITEEEIETNVYRLFLQRFRTGEFDEEAPYRDISPSVVECDEHVAVSEKASEDALVLLKNDDSFLPLKSDVSNVAVVGNLTNRLALGDYSGSPTKNVNPIDGITTAVKEINPNANVTLLGSVSDNESLFDVKSLKLVMKDGKEKEIDLSKAENVSGMTLEGGVLRDVTSKATACIKNVDFLNVASIKVEMSTGSRKGGSFVIAYGQGGPTVARAQSAVTADNDTFAVCTGDYTGEDGGYNGTADLYISAVPNNEAFTVANYKAQLDAADVIIAYGGTEPQQDGFNREASESKDRTSINLSSEQAHVQAICDAYPEKTVVVLSALGQINVEGFKDKCKAMLWTAYNGQAQGTALGNILTGKANPSGRLTTTWYKNSDVEKMELSNTKDQTIGGIKGKYTDYDIQADGTNPGHTYQYYSGTPVYPFGYGLSYTTFEYSNPTVDKTGVDANGTVKFTVDVKNTGTMAGREVVQLYVAHPGAGEGNTPKKQLKGFEKTALLQPGETETVEIELNVGDMYLFSESAQKDIVPTGTYTAYIAKNADDTSIAKTFDVTGVLDASLKTVKALPDGVSLNGLICEDGSALQSVTQIKANLSAVMNDESWYDLSKATVKYESSNTDVATVNSSGVVSSGAYEGVATITASVTIDGVTKTDSFPVVNKLQIKPSTDEINRALAELKAAYDKLPMAAYSETNRAEIEKIYAHGVDEIKAATTKAELDNILAQKINNMNSVPLDNLTETYTLSSVNPKHIEKGTIDYREGGIPMYDGATGTVTNVSPYSGIQMQVTDKDGNIVDSSKFVWQIKKYDNSVRKVADIDSETGELTVYGNGIIQITAANVEELTCGTLMVQVNMQIEGEYADDGNGADLTDDQNGSSGGHDAGSTADAWMEYKAVKLSNLETIAVRYAGKNAGVVNISLAKNSNAENLIASASLSATNGWSTWSTADLKLYDEVLYNAQLNGLLDEYGCATVYIQTNGINLDYFRLNYIENNDEEPYTIDKVLNKTDGRVKVTLGYRGSVLPTDVTLTAQAADKTPVSTAVKGAGEYELATGAADGDNVSFVVTDSAGKALSQTYEQIWTEPVDSEIVVYSLDSKDYDYTVLTGGSDNTAYEQTVNGLSGYGSWAVASKSTKYTYSDVNEKTYDYSFTKAWQAGGGSTTNRCLYFTPKAPCRVTALFNGGEAIRSMTIYQSEDNNITQPGTGSDKDFSLEITDITKPVYVYGGSSNKQLYAIIVEYYGSTAATAEAEEAEEAQDFDRPVQYTTWNGTQVTLTKNDLSGEAKVWTSNIDGSKTRLSTEFFYEADLPYSYDDTYGINKLVEYKGRLYAGCDNGLVIVFTDCMKCYKLKKAADIDIKDMRIEDGVMYITDGETEAEIPMSSLGADTIEAEEALVLAESGAVLIDVRSEEEFAEKSYEGSVNIPVDNIQEGLSAYDTDTTLIFYCSAGSRAETAVDAAREMGFERVYNLGSIDKLV